MDFDGDNILDIFSGSFFGHPVYVLRGTDKIGVFHEAEKILTDAGLPPLAGKRGKGKLFPHKCSKQYLADLNGDGLLDLIYGEAHGHFIKFDGVKNDKHLAFSDKYKYLAGEDKKTISIRKKDAVYFDGYSSPHFTDWDGDGDLDLLSGSAVGSVIYFENIGSPQKPVFAKPTILFQGPKLYPSVNQFDGYLRLEELVTESPNYVTSVTTTDYNGDGKLDLVIGDFVTAYKKARGISKRKFIEKEAEYQKLNNRIKPKLKPMQLTKLHDSYIEKKFTGYVWVLLRK